MTSTAFDPFRWEPSLCYESGPTDASGPVGERKGGLLRIERFPDIDLDTLPMNPSPPDHWQDSAACFGIDPDLFFPVSEDEAGPALAFCGGCRIREECLAWALKNGERYGVWGGLTEQQRRRVQRQVA